MNNSQVLHQYLVNAAFSLPMFLVWIGGFLFALVRRRNHPGVADVVIVATLLSMLSRVFVLLFMRTLANLDPSMMLVRLANFSAVCVSSFAWALLIYIAFADRPVPPRPS